MTLHKFPPDFKPYKKGFSKILGETESEVMEFLWEIEKGTVKEVQEEFTKRRQVAYTTIMTVMNRLVTKELLTVEFVGRKKYYRPTFTREQMITIMTTEVIDSLLQEFPDSVMSYIEELTEKEKNLQNQK